MKPHRDFQRSNGRPHGLTSRCKPCIRVTDGKRHLEWNREHANQIKTSNRRVWIAQKRDRDERRKAQGYRCAICNRHERSVGRLVRDHCHSTNRIRMMLCNGCNLGLGHFQDDIERMMLAVEYLREHR